MLALNVIYSVELLEFVLLLNALLVELFKRTVALSIISLIRGISCSSCVIEVCVINLMTPY